MIEAHYNSHMTSDEVDKFYNHWADVFTPLSFIGIHDYTIRLVIEHSYPDIVVKEHKQSIYVYDQKGGALGKFKPDHGMIKSGDYYPVVRFYNNLTFRPEFGAYNDGDPRNVSIRPNFETSILTLNEEIFIKAVRDSFDILSDHRTIYS